MEHSVCKQFDIVGSLCTNICDIMSSDTYKNRISHRLLWCTRAKQRSHRKCTASSCITPAQSTADARQHNLKQNFFLSEIEVVNIQTSVPIQALYRHLHKPLSVTTTTTTKSASQGSFRSLQFKGCHVGITNVPSLAYRPSLINLGNCETGRKGGDN